MITKYKEIVLVISFITYLNSYSQTKNCEGDTLFANIKVVAVDSIINVASTANSRNRYFLVLIEFIKPENKLYKKRLVVRNMFDFNLKEGGKYKVEIQKLISNCWVPMRSRYLQENADSLYRLLKIDK